VEQLRAYSARIRVLRYFGKYPAMGSARRRWDKKEGYADSSTSGVAKLAYSVLIVSVLSIFTFRI